MAISQTIRLLYNLANLFPEICSRQMNNTCPGKNLDINVYGSIVYNESKENSPKCLSIDSWINKIQYFHILRHYSATKTTEFMTYYNTT